MEKPLIKLHTMENPDPEPTEWIDDEASITDAEPLPSPE
jgi:hypothetical protein